jgi:hypothetical protein
MAKRGPKGKRKRKLPVLATPETLRKKHALVGSTGDIALAENPVGVMISRGMISAEDERHLGAVAKLWKFRNGSPSPARVNGHSGPNDYDSEYKTRRYVEMRGALAGDWLSVIEVAVYNEFPRWLLAEIAGEPLGVEDTIRRFRFLNGLAALERKWGANIGRNQ